MAVLAKLAKVVALSAKAAEKSAQRTPGHVTGHFARNANGGTHWVREYTRSLKGTQSHVMPQGITPLAMKSPKVVKADKAGQAAFRANAAGKLSDADYDKALDRVLFARKDAKEGIRTAVEKGRAKAARMTQSDYSSARSRVHADAVAKRSAVDSKMSSVDSQAARQRSSAWTNANHESLAEEGAYVQVRPNYVGKGQELDGVVKSVHGTHVRLQDGRILSRSDIATEEELGL